MSKKRPENPIEALELSIVLWEWLIDHPSAQKHDCPEVPARDWDGSCALCEYSDICAECPMYTHWPSATRFNNVCGLSVYIKWWHHRAMDYDISFFAAVLVEAFKERLAELA